MIRVLFVCHGNICRSPMAEFVMRDMVDKAGLSDCIEVQSAATTTEEIGNDTHPGTKRILESYGIPFQRRHARQIRRSDYEDFDYIIGMDRENMADLRYLLGKDEQGKVSKLLDWAGISRDVADPWYTGDYQATYDDVEAGCISLLEHLRRSLR